MNTITIDLGEINNSCFVVMPFSSLFQIEYEKIIQPALTELNIECVRGDEIYSKQRIVDDIWNSIKKCRFVLAELTDKNPNVLYEVGLAHAIGKPVIIITRNSDDVPFDLKALRYLFYDVNDPYWGENLKIGIQNLAKKVIENPTIEVYLEGISSNETITFPDLNIKPSKTKIVEKPSFNTSGTWFGEFLDNENVNHKVTLHINQNVYELEGSAVITFPFEDQQTVIQQMMNGGIKGNKLELHGVNYTFIERGNTETYALDSFTLTYDKGSNTLNGEMKSVMDDGEIVNSKLQLNKL